MALSLTALASPASGASGGGGLSGSSHRSSAYRKHTRRHGANQPGPLTGRGMWIWLLGSSNGGDLQSIIATAHSARLHTVFIKSGDGTSTWSQFNPQLVSTLHAAGLRVCAWQYVYGNHPITEAYVGKNAVRDGADCLMIDAEGEYEGKYVQAQAYITRLRKLIGPSFPVALAGLPYVDYHPAFPYSVFLGPGGAQYNAPQMYWVDIGTSVDAVYTHTYEYNRLYTRPIAPLGQIYNNPPSGQVWRFRAESRAYGATGISWWDWQEATPAGWTAVARPVGNLTNFTPSTAFGVLQSGDQGDPVVWAQLHLISAGYNIPVDGGFGNKTLTAVQSFQTAHNLSVDGVVGPATWQALLSYPPAPVIWTKRGARIPPASAAAAGGARLMVVPKSAGLRDKREELPRGLGSGVPKG